MKAQCNKPQLVMVSVMGEVSHPSTSTESPYVLTADGIPRVLPSAGGITYNVSIGDCAFGFAADHMEPGVTIKNPNERENASLNTLACVGNTAIVVSGDAKGARGFVTGTHGGYEHVLVYFTPETLNCLSIGDRILVRSYGQGMEISGFEDTVHTMNLDPDLFEQLDIRVENGKLSVPVAAVIPAHLMGSGIGKNSVCRGDYDIMTADRKELTRQNLDGLRFGDLVLLQNCDNSFGRSFRTGAASIGVVVHSDCVQAGHGPGVTTLLTSRHPLIEGRLDPSANLLRFFQK